MSASAFDLPKVVHGIGQVRAVIDDRTSGVELKYYLPYMLFMIPLISGGVFITSTNGQHALTRHIAIYGGGLMLLGLLGGSLFLQGEKFKPTDILSIGYYLTVLSCAGLVASGLGFIKSDTTATATNGELPYRSEPSVGGRPSFGVMLKAKEGLLIIGVLVIGIIGWGAYNHFTVSPEEAQAELKAMNIEFDDDGFFLAAKTGDIKAFKLFLQAGMHSDYRDNAGIAALHIATQNKQPEIIDLLVKAKADLELKLNDSGATPLAVAANVGCTECAQLLITAGANVNTKLLEPALTPLIIAAKRGEIEIVKLLLGHGADMKQISNDGMNALVYALVERHTKIAALLLDKGIDPNSTDSEGSSALIIAISHGDVGAVKALLAHHAKVDQVNRDGKTPIDYAIDYGNKEIIALLPGAAEKLKQMEVAPPPRSNHSAVAISPEMAPQSSPEETQSEQSNGKAVGIDDEVAKPSFDCTRASTTAELLVCADRQLAAADIEMAQAYIHQMNTGTAEVKAELKTQQNNWRKHVRDICTNTACVLKAYQKRIDELQD